MWELYFLISFAVILKLLLKSKVYYRNLKKLTSLYLKSLTNSQAITEPVFPLLPPLAR